MDSIDDPYLESRRSKSPLYDELSIPFIDASLPPTPKIGRSSNPLDILLGKHTESRTSLSGRCKDEQSKILHPLYFQTQPEPHKQIETQ